MATAATPSLQFVPAEAAGPPSWAEACEEFREELRLRRISPRTIAWYKSVLEPFGRHLRETLGHDRPQDVTEGDLRAFLAKVSEVGASGRRPVGARRLNHFRNGLFRFYEWAQRRGYVGHNPAANIPKVREPKRIIPTFTAAQVRALLQQPDAKHFLGLRDRLFLLLLLDTGLRLSEALGIRVGDLDLREGAVTVIGKGDKQRRVGLSPRLLAELRPYLRHREAALEGIERGDSPWLFPNHVGNRATNRAMQQNLRRYGKQAGIEDVRVSPHTLRHTYGLAFVRNGGDPFTLQKALGHTDLAMTRRYCELAEGDVLTRQRELSPLVSMDIPPLGGRRLRGQGAAAPSSRG
jgi:integrase/recombinase XerD